MFRGHLTDQAGEVPARPWSTCVKEGGSSASCRSRSCGPPAGSKLRPRPRAVPPAQKEKLRHGLE